MTDFARVLEDLHELDVRFVLTGGIAVISHGVIRATRDLDAIVAQDEQNLAKVGRLIERWSATRPDGTPLPDGWIAPGRVINLTGKHGPVDLLPDRPPELSFDALSSRAAQQRVDGVAADVISLADLVALKRLAGRPRDDLDLTALEQAHGALPDLPSS